MRPQTKRGTPRATMATSIRRIKSTGCISTRSTGWAGNEATVIFITNRQFDDWYREDHKRWSGRFNETFIEKLTQGWMKNLTWANWI